MKGAKWGIVGSREVELSPGFTSSKLVDILGYYDKSFLTFCSALRSSLWAPGLKSCSGKQQKCMNRQIVQARTAFYEVLCDESGWF